MNASFRLVAGQTLLLVLPLIAVAQEAKPDTIGHRWELGTQLLSITAEVVATGLRVPFGLAFLPDGRAILSDRPTRRLAIVDIRTGTISPLDGGPTVVDSVDAGMLDVVVHPDFKRNGFIYYDFAEPSDTGITTVVERARVVGTRLVDRQRIFAAYPAVASLNHLGSRLLLHRGYLFVTLGERDIKELAQELWTDHGKVIRLFEDGRIPPDNPFVGKPGARREIWSYGHRNPHGLAINPQTGELWESEHGPLGGDEINVVRPGANYGWPIATFGREYSGAIIGDGLTTAAGMVDPIHHYDYSAALSGMLFYTGEAFPQWRNSLFVGAMTPRYLGRLFAGADGRLREERLLLPLRWRVRVVQQGPDGFIYLGIEASRGANNGMIVRLRPAR